MGLILLYKSRILQLILCILYPFLYLGAYVFTTHYRIGYITELTFIALWVVYGLVLRAVRYALVCAGLALAVTLPLVYHLLVIHDTTSNFDFFPIIDIVFVVVAFVIELVVILIRNAVMELRRSGQ